MKNVVQLFEIFFLRSQFNGKFNDPIVYERFDQQRFEFLISRIPIIVNGLHLRKKIIIYKLVN